MPDAPGRFLAFGEIMLRLSPPGRELLLQSPRLDVWVAGAEANVATQLACLGHDVGFAGRVPDNDLGRAAIATLRGRGVDVRHIQRGGDRIGLYFVTTGAGMRATEVIYDRAHSAFAEAPPGAWAWDAILQGASRLHLSGITPALGPAAAAAATAAATAASERSIRVSFDGNWRGKLWERREADPRAVLTPLVRHADTLFGDHRDIALLLGRTFEGEGEDRHRAACDAAFAAFPALRTIASTDRRVAGVDHHHLAARIDTRDARVRTREIMLSGVVDRVGAGDAFAAGVLHVLIRSGDLDLAADTGLALAALKHSLPGDAALFRQNDIDALLEGQLDIRR